MKPTPDAMWMREEECPLLRPGLEGADAEGLRRLARLLRLGAEGPDEGAVSDALLAEVARALGADEALVAEAPGWQPLWRQPAAPPGRGQKAEGTKQKAEDRGDRAPPPRAAAPLPSAFCLLPSGLLGDVLHREAAVCRPPAGTGPALLAVFLGREPGNRVLAAVRAGEPFDRADLAYAVAAGRHLADALRRARDRREAAGRLDRAEALCAVARRVIARGELLPLLDFIAGEASRLAGCERASLFLWDQARGELVARPALGMEGGELRVPDDVGVAGKVVHTGRPYLQDDVRADPTWNPRVDEATGFRTRGLLCVPMCEPGGRCVGALEVLNKVGGAFTPEDVRTLEALAGQAGAALEDGRQREALLRSQAVYEDQARATSRIVGDSQAIRSLRATLERLARTDLPVLVLGESGTGKEVAARALHFGGPREHHPFVPVNCAALAETLLESELFGHVKGAFTGADQDRAGCFETASGGTLFLDEIGDLSAGGQAKLLRVLEDRAVCRVGSTRPIAINTRIVAATNRDLTDSLRAGKFREDLFYRLTVVTVHLPPLRDRLEDVPLLAEHYLAQFGRDAGRRLRLGAGAVRRLREHPWPGNVRELRNVLERVAFLCPHEVVEADDLPLIAREAPEAGADLGHLPLTRATDAFQRAHIRRAIERAGRNVSEAARLLGLQRSNLYRKMRLLGMDTRDLARGQEGGPPKG
jgi:Nif-specific regulatory protein